MANLPPVPHRSPMFDDQRFPTPVWADWFKQAFLRMGGHVAPTNDELNELFPVATVNIADDAVTAAKLRDDASTDANRAVTTNHIRDSAVSFIKLLSTDWTNSIAASGSQKLPSGLILKWGVTGSVSSGSTESVTPAAAFPTACLQVFASIRDNSAVATTTTGQWGTGNYSVSGFDIYNRTSGALTFNWMAVGH